MEDEDENQDLKVIRVSDDAKKIATNNPRQTESHTMKPADHHHQDEGEELHVHGRHHFSEAEGITQQNDESCQITAGGAGARPCSSTAASLRCDKSSLPGGGVGGDTSSSPGGNSPPQPPPCTSSGNGASPLRLDSRTETDVVHHRLSSERYSRRYEINSEPGASSRTICSSEEEHQQRVSLQADLPPHPVSVQDDLHQPVAMDTEPAVEFRNRSVEDLKSGNENIFQNGTIKQRLRKGMSVNDISECSVVVSRAANNHHNHRHHPVKLSLLRTFGLTRRGIARDEVTQHVPSPPPLPADHPADSGRLLPSPHNSVNTVEEYTGGGRRKMKNIKKTISNIFQFKVREGGGAAAAATGGVTNHDHSSDGRKLPNLLKFSKRNKSLPPSKRALPPVPSPSAPSSNGRRRSSRTPSPHTDMLGGGGGDTGGLSAANGAASEASPRLETGGQQQPPEEESQMDFAASIEKVKDHGWYWGPLSGEAAERILASEPDGSFVVRDSSDQHYIFSLTFKLNGFVRHVRIEHDQGNFSFGSFTKFKSTTIVDFIENAVEHSRSGRYLFFLHRRPVLGPMRVQLLHPVSRFKRVQSLQHLCRYVIVKLVRKDHLDSLPIPNRIKTYLNTPFYYSEQVAEENEEVLPSVNLDDLVDDEEEEDPADNLNPAAADPLNPADPVADSAGPATNPVGPAINFVDPAPDPVGSPMDLASDPVGSALDRLALTADPVSPATNPTDPLDPVVSNRESPQQSSTKTGPDAGSHQAASSKDGGELSIVDPAAEHSSPALSHGETQPAVNISSSPGIESEGRKQPEPPVVMEGAALVTHGAHDNSLRHKDTNTSEQFIDPLRKEIVKESTQTDATSLEERGSCDALSEDKDRSNVFSIEVKSSSSEVIESEVSEDIS